MTRPKHQHAPTLETERLILRRHRLDDFPKTLALWSDPEIVRFVGPVLDEEHAWNRFLRYAGSWTMLGYGAWLVETHQGEFIGEAGINWYRRDLSVQTDGAPEAGWVFRLEHAGRGFATEAVSAMLAWADDNLAADRILAIFDPAHAASIAVGRKLGFGGDVVGTHDGDPTIFMWRQARR